MNRIVPDAPARADALDPKRSFIVQAPAGSGKTGLLIQRYLALLARVGSPEEIIAITFTRKAAGEMRQRILEALKSVRDRSVRDEPEKAPENDHEQKTRELAGKAYARDLEQGWKVPENPSRLSIGTIDSLCAALTRRMPVQSGFGMLPDIAEDADALYREAAANTVLELESQKDWSGSVEALLRHLDNHIGKVEGLIAEMLSRRDQWLRHVAYTADIRVQRENLEAALSRVIGESLERVQQAMPDAVRDHLPDLARFAAENLLSERPASPICLCLAMDSLPGAAPQDLEAWIGVAELLLTAEGGFRKGVNRRIGFPPAPVKTEKERYAEKKAAFQALLAEIGDCAQFARALDAVRRLPAYCYTEEQWRLVEALFGILKLAVAHLQVVFQEKEAVDFTEIALRAASSLGDGDDPSDLALLLDYRIRHILVDEFQDTAISQFDLFLKLTAGWSPGDGRTFFAVGDPMQSIYSFREAEVGLFLRAWEAGLGPHLPLERVRLTANFRSDPGIVNWVNRTFPDVLPEESDPSTGAVAYSPAEAVDPYSAADDAPAGDPDLAAEAVRVHPVIGPDEKLAAERVAACVHEEQARFPNGRLAILVRTRSHLKQILPALRQANIGYRAVEIDSLGERPVISDLVALTLALSHPADRTAWLAVLRAPWCGLSLGDLFVLAGEDYEETLFHLLQDSGVRGKMSGDGQSRLSRALPVLTDAMSMRGRHSVRCLVERTWMALGGPACAGLQDIREAAMYFDFLEKTIGHGILADRRVLEDGVMKLYCPPDTEADGSLEVMTIHKAKGLEFDAVILPGLDRIPRGDAEKLLLWQEIPGEDNEGGLLLAPIAETGGNLDPTYSYIKGLHKEKNAYETGRLLYVAATRARRRLHLVGSVRRSDAGMPVTPDPRSLLRFLWRAVEPDFTSACEAENEPVGAAGGAGSAGAGDAESEGLPIRRLKNGWSLPPLPPDAILQPPDSEMAEEDAAEADQRFGLRFDWAGMMVRMTGTVIHKWLRIICETGVNGWDENRLSAVSGRIRADLAGSGMDPARLDEAAGHVISALARSVSDDVGRWILSSRESGRCEYPLSGVARGRVHHVVIDRTFIDENGTRWIIDYKSGVHTGSGLEDFMEQERLRYDNQTALYADLMVRKDPLTTVRRALYFPMFAGWCLWSDEFVRK